jgi:broad specificity phosphatase PhoE
MVSAVYLVRHGETEWSHLGLHTSRSDVPLSADGEAQAARLAPRLAAVSFSRVFTSPRIRATRTCELAGLGPLAIAEPDLAEWGYGQYEGLRSAEISAIRPGWRLFRDGCPGGESPAQVSERADRVVAMLRQLSGAVAVFTHGHFGRALAARWADLPVWAGEGLLLEPAALGVLGFEHGSAASPVISLWNERP